MAGRYQELGVASDYSPNWGLRQDEYITELRGTRGIKRLREMRDNDPIIGAILASMDLMIRATKWRVEGPDDESNAFLNDCLHNMQDRTFEEFIADALSFLPYGFSLFEIVYKKRQDGKIGIGKLAPRAQWTIDRFDVTDTGEIKGVYQSAAQKSAYIPFTIYNGVAKMLHFRAVSINNEPSGRSILRNAYTSWYAANEIKRIEAIAIERELNGLPIVTVPSEYLSPDATESQKAFINQIKKIARDVKRNEQGYIVLPSDLYADDDGKLTTKAMVDFRLIASQGTRDIDTGKTILRLQQDMARSAMADFIMLGANDRGSFALSQSKSQLFLRALEGYADVISGTMNRVLIPSLWKINGFDPAKMPKLARGRVAPVDLEELGNFIQRATMAGAELFPDTVLEDHVRDVAGLPPKAQADA